MCPDTGVIRSATYHRCVYLHLSKEQAMVCERCYTDMCRPNSCHWRYSHSLLFLAWRPITPGIADSDIMKGNTCNSGDFHVGTSELWSMCYMPGVLCQISLLLGLYYPIIQQQRQWQTDTIQRKRKIHYVSLENCIITWITDNIEVMFVRGKLSQSLYLPKVDSVCINERYPWL
jgi:hypothetical protein